MTPFSEVPCVPYKCKDFEQVQASLRLRAGRIDALNTKSKVFRG